MFFISPEKRRKREELRLVRRHFDKTYYFDRYGDVRWAKQDALKHFLAYGWKEGRNPNEWFDTNYYLENNPDVAEADINPLVHYLRYGKEEGRAPSSGDGGAAGPRGGVYGNLRDPKYSDLDADSRLVVDNEAFDAEYYCCTYSDVTASGTNPLDHFMTIGWREGKNPSDHFETSYYLAANPDVREREFNPLLHFLRHGKSEGRKPYRAFRYYRQALNEQVPFEDLYKSFPKKLDIPRMSSAKILKKLSPLLIHDSLVISLSHDNYLQSVGGVQICVSDEQIMLNELGLDYLHMFPANPKPSLAKEKIDDFMVSVNVNGETVGTFPASSLLSALENLSSSETESPEVISIVIHHLLGFNLDFVSTLIEYFSPPKIFVWLHDYFTVCAKYTLQRNDIRYCGAPPIDSNACRICNYGHERSLIQPQFKDFFEKHNLEIVAPSQYALDLWKEKSNLTIEGARVNPHCELTYAENAKTRQPYVAGRPIRVAYLGLDFPNKGWFEWKRLTERYRGDEQFEFVHLGKRTSYNAHDRFVPVSVSADNRLAMLDALLDEDIDIAFLWSKSPETFSFTVHEAAAAGCYILTNVHSGNIQAQLKADKATGLIFNDIEELEGFMDDGHLFEELIKYRAQEPKIGGLRFTPFLLGGIETEHRQKSTSA